MRILLTGAGGYLGLYLWRELLHRQHTVTPWTGSQSGERFGQALLPVDLAEEVRVQAAFAEAHPELVIHAGALASVAECHRFPERAMAVNVRGSESVMRLCASAGIRMLHISTDMIFDGNQGNYREIDLAVPPSVYGTTKLQAETIVGRYPRTTILRVSLLFGPSLGRPSFFDQQVTALREQRSIRLFDDEWRTPIDCKCASRAIVDLCERDVSGVFHLGGPGRLSRFEMGQRLAAFLGVPDTCIIPCRRADVPTPEPRARDLSLDSSRVWNLLEGFRRPTFEEALREM